MRPLAPTGLAVLALAACGGGESATAPPPGEPPPRTVVLVVLDSVRADHVGSLGYPRATTPRLDALAAAGVVYERAYAASSSDVQSLAALWTGRLPTNGGGVGLREAAPHPALVSLPRLFLRAGYATALVSNDPGLRERGFTRGCDRLEVDSVPGRWPGELVTRKALDVLDAAGEAPAFLVVGYADASEPHLPSDELRGRFPVPRPQRLLSLDELRGTGRRDPEGRLPAGLSDSPGFRDLVARYDAEIARVDACLGALVDGLVARGRLTDALVVVTSSHGVELLEHGYVGAGWTLHEEVLRVPLVLHAPGRLAPGRVEAPVSLVDVVPTLREVLGLPAPEVSLDGRSLLARAGGGLEVAPPTGEVLAELVIPELAILRASIRHDWKLVHVLKEVPPAERAARLAGYEDLVLAMQAGEEPRPDLLGIPLRSELYHLAEDPGGSKDLAGAEPERAESLAATLARYAEACRAGGLEARLAEASAAPPDEADLGQLEQIGYL